MKNLKKTDKSFLDKKLLYSRYIYGFLVLSCLLAAVFYFQDWVVSRGEHIERSSMLTVISTAAAGIEPELVKSLVGKQEDLGTEIHESLLTVLRRIKSANDGIRFIYIVTNRGGNIVFLVDAEPPDSDDYSPPGQIYEEVPIEFKAVFSTSQPNVVGPFTDRWGIWVTGISPINDPDSGDVVAVIGMDVSAGVWEDNIRSYRWFAISIGVLMALILLGSTWGISYLKSRNAKIRYREERFRHLLDSTPDSTLIVKGNGDIILANASSEQTFGYTVDELLNLKISTLIPEQFRDVHIQHQTEFIASPKKRDMGNSMDLWALKSDGNTFPVEISLSPIETEEGLLVIACIRDITKRKKQEQITKLSADVGEQLIASITLRKKLQACTDAIVNNLDLAFVRIWTVDKGEPMLTLHASSGLYTSIEGTHKHVEIGKKKIGKIAAGKEPVFIKSIYENGTLDSPEWAKENDLQSYYGYPMLVEDEVVGVIGAFSRSNLSQDVIESLTTISNTMAVSIERKRAEEELKERMEDLERFSSLTINREEKMIQLKEEINTLLGQMGKEKKFKIVE